MLPLCAVSAVVVCVYLLAVFSSSIPTAVHHSCPLTLIIAIKFVNSIYMNSQSVESVKLVVS